MQPSARRCCTGEGRIRAVNKVLALILLAALCGCSVGKQQNSFAANQDIPPLASAQVPVRTALPSPIAPAAPDKQSEPRAEVVPLPADTEVDSTASNNATQQSATGALNLQTGKVAESVDVEASLARIDSKISANNEMSAELRNDVRAQATAIAELKLKVDANVQGQAGLSNRIDQVTTTAGRDVVTQFSDGMERFMTRLLQVVEHMANVIYGIIGGTVLSCVMATITIVKVFAALIRSQDRLRAKDEARDDELTKLLIQKGGAK
jgi:hypothetical protein